MSSSQSTPDLIKPMSFWRASMRPTLVRLLTTRPPMMRRRPKTLKAATHTHLNWSKVKLLCCASTRDFMDSPSCSSPVPVLPWLFVKPLWPQKARERPHQQAASGGKAQRYRGKKPDQDPEI